MLKIDAHKKYKDIYRVTDVFNVSFETDESSDEDEDPAQNLINYIGMINNTNGEEE